jgi:sulfatase modifying factor 1
MPDQVIDFSTLDTVEFNGTDLTKVIFNGTTIWEKLIFEREFVSIGDAGNTEDNQTGFGSVIYNYSIAKTAEPLVSLKLYNADPLNASNQIDITNTRYDINDSSNNLKPIISTSFIEVCRYVNWLNIKEGEQPAYKFNGGTIEEWTSAKAWQAGGENLWRHKDAKYFIPSRNEWYKAAYSKGSSDPSAYFDYATGSNTAPTPVTSGTAANTAVWNFKSAPADVDKCGGLSRYGTIGQSGNVYEWSDFNVGIINPLVRLGQGGYWYSSIDTRMSRNYYLIHTNWVTKMTTNGIRVATADVGTGSVPEIEYIGGSSAQAFQGGTATTSAIDTTGADLIVAYTSSWTSHGVPSDSEGNTWTRGFTNNNYNNSSALEAKMWYCTNPNTSSTHNFIHSAYCPAITVMCFSGISSAPSIVKISNTSGAPGLITPSTGQAFLFISALNPSSGGTAAINNGFTIDTTLKLNNYQTANWQGSELAYKIQYTNTVSNPTWSGRSAYGSGQTVFIQ